MPRILLADHHPTSRRVIELSFAEEDFEVVSFDDGAAALGYLHSNPADLVMADVSLPAVNGYELCREVHSDARISRAPVILLVGRFDPFDIQLAEEVGYHSHLTKPIEPHNLVDLVGRLTGAGQPGPPQEPAAHPSVLLGQAGERSSGMLFDLPLEEGRPKVVFPLKIYQCEPSPAMVRRDSAVFVEAPEVLPQPPQELPAPEVPLEEPASESPQPQQAPLSADASQPLEETSAPPQPSREDEQVDRVMSKLSEKLPDVIRAILQEEKGG